MCFFFPNHSNHGHYLQQFFFMQAHYNWSHTFLGYQLLFWKMILFINTTPIFLCKSKIATFIQFQSIVYVDMLMFVSNFYFNNIKYKTMTVNYELFIINSMPLNNNKTNFWIIWKSKKYWKFHKYIDMISLSLKFTWNIWNIISMLFNS